METLGKNIESIGLELMINCILVQHDVRPAFLIQPADYSEATSSDPKTSAMIAGIRRYFPNLILSEISGETLVSKRAYVEADIKTDVDMGTIIGYPCAKDYPYIREHQNTIKTTTIDIIAHLLPGGNTDSLQILAYACLNDSQYTAAKKFAADCERVLKSSPIVGAIISSVEAELRVNVPVSLLIEKFVQGVKKFNDDEHYAITNYIANLGFDNIHKFRMDYSNPVHRGIIIALLTLYKNNPLSAFYPLQDHAEGDESNRINSIFELELINIFSAVRGGARRKTMKNRR